MGYLDRPTRIAKWLSQPAASVALRYGLALASVAAALGLAQTFLHFHLPQPFAAFALSAIAITFWYGGTGPGILAAVLSSLVRTYFFEPEANTVSRFLYDLVFLVFALLMMQGRRSIVESHGGRVWSGDNSPCGASFYVTLPATTEANE